MGRVFSSCGVSLLLAVVLLAAPAVEAGSRERAEVAQLAVGRLLVAMPQMRDPRFQETVVLLLDYGGRGAMGVVLNRPTALDLNQAFEPEERAAEQTLFFGGPVQADRNLILVDSDAPVPGGVEVMPGLYLLHEAEDVDRLLQAPRTQHRFRVFSGYAGWGPQQLEHEIYQGDWLVLKAPAALILDTLPEALWPQLIRYSHSQIAFR